MDAGIKRYISKFMRLDYKRQRVPVQEIRAAQVSDFWIFWNAGDRNNMRCTRVGCISNGYNFVLI